MYPLVGLGGGGTFCLIAGFIGDAYSFFGDCDMDFLPGDFGLRLGFLLSAPLGYIRMVDARGLLYIKSLPSMVNTRISPALLSESSWYSKGR